MIVENLFYKGIVTHSEDRDLLLQLVFDASKLIQTATRAIEIECGIGVSQDESIARNSKKNARHNLVKRAGSVQQDLENLNLYLGDSSIDPKTRWVESRQIAADQAKTIRTYVQKCHDTATKSGSSTAEGTDGSTHTLNRQMSAYENVMRNNPMADAVAEDFEID